MVYIVMAELGRLELDGIVMAYIVMAYIKDAGEGYFHQFGALVDSIE